MVKKGLKRQTAVVATAAFLLSGCFGNSAEEYLAAAKTDLAKKDNAAALIQLKNALQKNASLPEARVLLGQVLLDNGDVRGAAIELAKAKDLGYSGEILGPLTARALVGQGLFQKVVSDYADTKLNSPTAMAALQTSLAIAYAGLGKLPQAQQNIDAAVAADSSNVRAQLVRVRLLATSGPTPASSAALEELIAKAPKNSEVWQLKGDLLVRGGQPEEALKAYRQAVTLDKGNVPAHVGIITLLMSKKDLDGATAELAALRAAKAGSGQVLMFTALLALERNDVKLAHETLQSLLKIAPEDPRVLHLAGAIEFRRGALVEADDFLNKTLQASPNLVKARLLLAQTNLRQGDAAKALTVLQPLLGDENNSVEAYTIAAEAYLQSGDPKRAEEYFAKASHLSPNDVRSKTALALVQIGKGQVDAGIAALRTIAASDPNPMPDMGLVTAFMQRKDWNQALKAIDGLEAKTPGKPTAANLRGSVELALGDRDKARQAFEAAIKIDRVFFPATASLAALDLEDKHPDAAAARFQTILKTQPNSVQANMALIAVRSKAGATKDELVASLNKLVKQLPSEAQPRQALIELLIERKDFKAALAAAQDAAAAVPDNPEVWRFLGQVQALSGDANQAASSFNKWASLAPKSPEPQFMLAELAAKQGDKLGQMQALKRSLGVKADFQPAQLAMFSLELSSGHFSEARKIADIVQTQRPADSMGRALVGDVDLAQKNWPAAVADYRAALKLRATSEVAIKLHRALQLAGGDKRGEVKQFETEWLAAHPGDLAYIDYLANSALVQENYELAEQRYLDLLKTQPDNAVASNNLAWLLNKTRKPGALEYSEKANKLVPDQPAFMDTLAQIYADSGQLAKAVEVQKRAVTLAPELALHRLHLARYYAAAGQKSEARNELSKLSALGSKFSEQAEVNKLLATL